MDLSNLNVYLLSTYSSAPSPLREKLKSFGVESFGFYQNYKELKEIVAGSDEACLVIDLLENENLKFNIDFNFFALQAAPFAVAQALRWIENTAEKPIVEIDSNFRIINEELWPIDEIKDGLVRLPLYYFSNGEASKYVTDDGILFRGEEWIGLPIGYSQQELDYSQKIPALFLDRDGIINEDAGYVYQYERIKYKQDIFTIIELFNDRSWPVFILTNQSGVGQGKYLEEDVIKLHEEMKKDFKNKKLEIQEWVYSPYHFEKGIGPYKRMSFTRKPGAGMALKILETYAVDLENSFMIGDKLSDQLLLPGVKTLLLKGNYSLEGAKSLVFDDLKEIENFIREQL